MKFPAFISLSIQEIFFDDRDARYTLYFNKNESPDDAKETKERRSIYILQFDFSFHALLAECSKVWKD